MKNNGEKLGPRARSYQLVPRTEMRIVYGSRCTWWSGRAEAKARTKDLVCPHCEGPLLEVPNEKAFWFAVQRFEDGGPGVSKPHPGYIDFMKWMRGRCFRNVQMAAITYKANTGTWIELDPADFREEDPKERNVEDEREMKERLDDQDSI